MHVGLLLFDLRAPALMHPVPTCVRDRMRHRAAGALRPMAESLHRIALTRQLRS